MCVRALWKAIFPTKSLPQYKEGCTPDLIAIFCDDVEKYAHEYKHLLSDQEVLEEPYADVVNRVLYEKEPDYRAYGWSELEVALFSGDQALVEELLSKQENVTINTLYHGKTLLEYALNALLSGRSKDCHIVKKILHLGADPLLLPLGTLNQLEQASKSLNQSVYEEALELIKNATPPKSKPFM